MHTTKNSTRLILDKGSQDCNNFQAQFLLEGGIGRNIGGVVWSFTRKFETCTKNQEEDYILKVKVYEFRHCILRILTLFIKPRNKYV